MLMRRTTEDLQRVFERVPTASLGVTIENPAMISTEIPPTTGEFPVLVFHIQSKNFSRGWPRDSCSQPCFIFGRRYDGVDPLKLTSLRFGPC